MDHTLDFLTGMYLKHQIKYNLGFLCVFFYFYRMRVLIEYIKGAPGVLGIWGRMAIYFQGAGEHW